MEGSQEKEKETNVSQLQHKFINLQKDWDSFKMSCPKTISRLSTNYSNSNIVKTSLQYLEDNSPREIMSSLQRRSSKYPPEGIWKVRTNELAVEEIIRERREALESGKLKGRRLFVETDEMDFGELTEDIGLDWINIEAMQESHDVIRSVMSFDFDYSDHDGESNDSYERKEIPVCFQGGSSRDQCSVETENFEVEEKIVPTVNYMEEKRINVNGWIGKNGVMRCTVLHWLITVVFVVIGIYITVSHDGYGGHENQITLVPT